MVALLRWRSFGSPLSFPVPRREFHAETYPVISFIIGCVQNSCKRISVHWGSTFVKRTLSCLLKREFSNNRKKNNTRCYEYERKGSLVYERRERMVLHWRTFKKIRKGASWTIQYWNRECSKQQRISQSKDSVWRRLQHHFVMKFFINIVFPLIVKWGNGITLLMLGTWLDNRRGMGWNNQRGMGWITSVALDGITSVASDGTTSVALDGITSVACMGLITSVALGGITSVAWDGITSVACMGLITNVALGEMCWMDLNGIV